MAGITVPATAQSPKEQQAIVTVVEQPTILQEKPVLVSALLSIELLSNIVRKILSLSSVY